MLHKHFRDEMVNSAHFSSSWFITLFSSTYEPPLLLKFWDMFLSQGWKAIFRIGIVILQRLEERLIMSDFTEIVMLLKEIHLPTCSI